MTLAAIESCRQKANLRVKQDLEVIESHNPLLSLNDYFYANAVVRHFWMNYYGLSGLKRHAQGFHTTR